jgi:uncharacterized protein (DUF2141 family)
VTMNGRIGTSCSLLLLAAGYCLLSCAKEGMPPGGPEDTTPPEVVAVSPSAGATGISLDSEIQITFSERMTPDITEQSVFVSPLTREPFRLRWKGKKLILSPQEPLDPDRTYVVSVGADAQDLRRNRLGQTYTLAFSTGSKLDFGTISGQVWAMQEVGLARQLGASVWAYLLRQAGSEPDPSVDKPDYVTQTDDLGAFVFKNLSLGSYRLFAVQDLNRNLLWDWENEPIGVTTGDVELNDRRIAVDRADLVLELRDKTNPRLLSCNGINLYMVRLDFDEEINPRSASAPTNYRLRSTRNGETADIRWAFVPDADTSQVTLFTEEMVPEQEYDLYLVGVTDLAGNPVDSAADSCRFKASGLPDTVGPEITVVKPADGETNLPQDAPITVTFNQPVDHERIESSFSLLNPDDVPVPGSGEWPAANVYLFKPKSLLSGNTRFRVSLPARQILDLAGNLSPLDSVFTSAFTTVNPETLGLVSGSLDLEDGATPFAASLILWQQAANKVLYRLSLAEPGSFRFDGVLPGKYLLAAYLDSNRDGLFSLGNPRPFLPMEPFVVYPDTIPVRSRWETEVANMVLGRQPEER